MERTSERIWRAARAAYESRGQLKVFMPWDDLRQVSRDIEYDAMVAAFEAVPPLLRLEARIAELDAAYVRLRKMIPGAMPAPPHCSAEEAWAHTEAMLAWMRARADCDLLGVHERRIAELEAALGISPGEPVRKGWVLGVTREEFDRWKGQEAALKPFAEYAELYVELKQAPLDDLIDVRIPMSWFIAALKAYRGETAPPSEDKT